jgi:type I restriction enzyme M protein
LIIALAKCHQTLWGGGRLSPPAAFGELCKLIFVKLHDETTLRGRGEPYDFQLRTGETSRELADRIRNLYNTQKDRDPDIFSDPIRVDDHSLRTLVSHLEQLNLSATELDVKGVAFEQFMDGFFKGDFGQYFTPREIIKLAVEMIGPNLDDVIIDPAVGSGGFLLHALDHVRGLALNKGLTAPEAREFWIRFAQKNLFGVEINEELTRVAKMNLIIHGDGHSNIVNSDALAPIEQLSEKNKGIRKDRFDLVLTNPPFGATVTAVTHPNLPNFDLGRRDPFASRSPGRKTQKTEILFIERVWELLKPGSGHAAIVLPDGVLANAQSSYVREWVLQRFQVLAVVSLPATAFTHYGAAVKSSLVILRKRAKTESARAGERIFMSAPQLIGYDAVGRSTDNELPRVVAAYQSFMAVERSR